MDLRELKLKRPLEKILPFSTLERVYQETRKKCIQLHPPEKNQTEKENDFYRLIKSKTKMEVYRSFLIGKRFADFFIPCLKGEVQIRHGQRQMQGVVIEIDGKVHDKEYKMRKDNSKYELIHKLDIALSSIDNEDVEKPSTRNLIRSLTELPRLDTRGRRRLIQKVYLTTLARNSARIDYSKALSSEQLSIIQQVNSLLKSKR